MSPYNPPPPDAPEPERWVYVYGQIAELHECFETRQEATDKRVEVVLAAVGELKAEVKMSAGWISAEEGKRHDQALVEEGRKQERQRWVGWLDAAREWAKKGLDLGVKVGLGAGVLKAGQMVGLW